MDTAFHKLQILQAFKQRRRQFSDPELRQWIATIRFFSKGKRFLETQRNVYGAHFHDDAAKFILANVDDTPASFEVRFGEDGKHHYVFLFAHVMVSFVL